MGLIGAHVSTAGGTPKAFERGSAMGCESIQIFVKSPNQWRAKPLAAEEITAFRSQHASSGWPVAAHAAYLINLGSPKDDLRGLSAQALADELSRCDELGLAGLVVHPGAHLGAGEAAGIELVARSIDAVFAAHPAGSTLLLLENTAGQGSTLGRKFEELRGIIDLVDQKERLGVCFDTCHAFAAGYDLSTADGYQATFTQLDAAIGLGRVKCLHVNDSKHPLGSQKDRHENIGLGLLGEACFARLVNDAQLARLPMILETPLGDDELGHHRDMDRLRALRS